MNLFDRKILDIYGLVHYMTPSSQHGYINACGVKRFEFPAKAFPISTLKGIKDSTPSENASTSYLMNHRRHLYQTNIVSKQQDGVDHAHKQVT